MKIFLTGCGSFIGREVIRVCQAKGIQVVGVDLVATGQEGCSMADIRKPEVADKIPENVDAIIHLAALSRDPDCRNRAYECFDANVMGTLNLMEAAQKRGAKQFIFASSEWVYDSFQEGVEKREEDVVDIAKLTSEYALSKLVTEANLRQKFQHGFCPVTILRFGIVYGPRKNNWAAVESVLNAVKTQDEVSVGSLKTGRRFIHVADIAAGIVASVGLTGFEIINLQGDKMVTLGDVIETGKKLLNRNPKVTEKTPGQVSIRTVSDEKSKRLLKWRPEISLEAGLKSILEFWQAHP
ncbi:MAG TPA: NAD(P)-dependent oxidoreductase [Candidatus Sulfotelmatobacter sp.]|jgi:UDP-glucose 4-epimerase|nr:NAD(P)-dependent oxidoreductase [Candidatus Sulfotelmatobacter sp.]